jgi:hypothetical protein
MCTSVHLNASTNHKPIAALCLSQPDRTPGSLASRSTLVDCDLPIDQHHPNPRRRHFGRGESRNVTDGVSIEQHQIRPIALLHKTAILQSEHSSRPPRQVSHDFLQPALENRLGLNPREPIRSIGVQIPRLPLPKITVVVADVSRKRPPTSRMRFRRGQDPVRPSGVHAVAHDLPHVRLVAGVLHDRRAEVVGFEERDPYVEGVLVLRAGDLTESFAYVCLCE